MRTAVRGGRERVARAEPRPGDPLWYKDAVFYEIRVGAFQDGDGDGIGDFRGLTARLDYLQDLGVTVLWLLPFCRSPLRDDGYDISDYTDIHPDSGTLEDFKTFLREAHRRGLRVVTELVVNHTSDAHPWFQRARRAPPDGPFRRWYVWSDTPERYPEARIIFKDFERSNWTWDPVAGAYYFHRFYAHQPDLNFDEPAVRRELLRVVDFWFRLGVDGLRLDAVPYLFERDGTTCENLPETHAFLKELRAHVDARWRDRMLLAEANQWPEDAIGYFGAGDECHMAFHFPLMPRLFMALHMEDRHPVLDILRQTPEIPATCQWALFLRNHDELTLEMVTDEERDYMYRVYSHDARARINLGIRRRLSPLLGNDRRRIELLNALLFSLPGTPILYYGDEIGMGDNFYLGDRNGVRTPMQWSSDRNAGFSTANPQRLFLPIIIDPEYHYETVNVEAQQHNPHSLLNWMKRLIALRKRTRAFGHGSIGFLEPSNRKVLAFVREAGEERVLVVANLSRFVEYVELDLSAYKGMVAVEMFGRKPFPAIADHPYLLTLGPHAFYWFSLETMSAEGPAPGGPAEPLAIEDVTVAGLATPRSRDRATLESILPRLLPTRRWFGAKASQLLAARIDDAIPIGNGDVEAALLLVRTESERSGAESWALPVAIAHGEHADEIARDRPQALFAEMRGVASERGRVFDALEAPGFATALLDGIARRRRFDGSRGLLVCGRTREFRRLRGDPAEPLVPVALRADQSNSSVAFGTRLVLKLFRRLTSGVNPDLEIGRFLTERARFTHVPQLAGYLEYQVGDDEPVTIGVLQEWRANGGDAWQWSLDRLRNLFEEILARQPVAVPSIAQPLLALAEGPPPPPLVLELLGGYLESIRLLGRRTGELHVALASDHDDPAFAPERFTPHYQRSLYQSMRNLAVRTLDKLRASLRGMPSERADAARRLLSAGDRIAERFRDVTRGRLDALRIRCHGDLHLGQVLNVGHDFVFIDFEGEPARPLGERRLKRSPLRDVAGMLRSFDYAAQGALLTFAREGAIRTQDVPRLQPWADLWRDWVGSSFLRAYLRAVEPAHLVPRDHEALERLLHLLWLEKAVYELGYELDHRPDWVGIPLRAVLQALGLPAPAMPV